MRKDIKKIRKAGSDKNVRDGCKRCKGGGLMILKGKRYRCFYCGYEGKHE